MIYSKKIILASSSKYRKQLLERLDIQFDCVSPNIDENTDPNISPKKNAVELSIKKAKEVAKTNPDSIIIASDQLCSLNGKILGKPGNFDNAFKQLKDSSGQKVKFYTGLCVLHQESEKMMTHCDTTTVYFRELADQQITQYLHKDKPYDCAGSFKAESLGICLFKKIKNTDPTALIGLPLIKLCQILNSNFAN